MKKFLSLYLLVLVLSSFLLTSCSSSNNLTIGVTEPAPVDFPSSIKSVGLINRTNQIDSSSSILDGIDKVLSLEGRELDKLGAEQSITGLYNLLFESKKFETIKKIETPDIKSSFMAVFPAPLSWEKIDEICKANGVDAIFELSFYDTDASVVFDAVPVTVSTPIGTTVTLPEHQLTITTFIKTGWRIYDNTTRTIRDEFIITEKQVSSGRGINPMIAFETVTGRKEAVLQISQIIGKNYGYRIFPYNIRVSRIYYVRGTQNFKVGKRKAQVGDWHGAAKLWEKELNNPKRKIAGRACYNMAIINEIDGNLEDAIVWAAKSYTDYKNKEGLKYKRILENRMYRLERLKKQQE
jgi:hypothetical protein